MQARTFFLGILLIVLSHPVWADTTWVSRGTVSGNWTAEHSPYVVEGDVHVPAGQSLAISAGVRVYFDGLYRIEVDSLGDFSATGAEGDSVVFTTDTLLHPLRWCGILIHAPTDTVRMSYCVIENMKRDSTRILHQPNHADTVAPQSALRIEHEPGLNLSHSSLRQCVASGWGGAIEMIGGHAAITDCYFADNSGVYGGAINLQCPSEIAGCVFERNSSYGGGGAIHICFGSQETSISSCMFRENHCWGPGLDGSGGGGAIWHHNGILRLTECSFHGDSIISPWIYRAGGGAVNSNFDGLDSTLTLIATRCLFDHCRGGSLGGAVAIENGSIINCTVVGTSTAHGAYSGGGAIYGLTSALRDTVRVLNTIVADSPLGKGIVGDTRKVQIHNCLVYENADGIGRLGSPADSLYGRVTQANVNGDSCDVYQNLFLDPQFVDTTAGDYHLLSTSPCIDAGDPDSPRDPDGSVADIGAFSFAHLAKAKDGTIDTPSAFALSASPNPFNPSTIISFTLPRASAMTLEVFDVTGRLVQTLMDKPLESGVHAVRFDGGALPSGVYFVQLQSGDRTQVRKLMLLK